MDGLGGLRLWNQKLFIVSDSQSEVTANFVNPRVMVSIGAIHGQCIDQRDGSKTMFSDLDTVRPRDVVQYLECKFERRQNGRLVQSSSAGAPDHTSYLTSQKQN